MHANEKESAGFWIRLLTLMLDLIVIVLGVIIVAKIAVFFGWYVPIELTVILTGTVYNVIAIALSGQTLGKWFCGLTVFATNDNRPGLARIFLRETIAKLISGLPLLAGFALVGFSRRKMALHDYIAGTKVLRGLPPLGRLSLLGAVLIVVVILAMWVNVPGLISIYQTFMEMKLPTQTQLPFETRNLNSLTEASVLTESQISACAQWISNNSTKPVDYVMNKAMQHQVTILGEIHDKKDNLDLLNELIPQVYRRASVTCVAMEVCLAEDNEKIQQLVTAPQFDRALAMQIARHQPWCIWGSKGYWDVFETVWKVNQTIPAGQKKMRVIGLDSSIDMPSLAMMGLEDNPITRHAPLYERLRMVRLIRELPRVLARDVSMARQVELEIIAKGERGIVWIGEAHNSASPVSNGFDGPRQNRMGFLLRQRHKDKIFQIRLHLIDIPIKEFDQNYRGPEPIMAESLERIMAVAGGNPVGFDLAGSPLALLRDNASPDYYFEPRFGLGDLTDGYIYLKPCKQMKHCEWLSDYISPTMFAVNKPIYQAFAKVVSKQVSNASEANRIMDFIFSSP